MVRRGSLGRSRRGPWAPDCVRGLMLPNAKHYEGVLLEADVMDRALVNASSWLVCVIGDWRYPRTLSSTCMCLCFSSH